MAGKGDRPRPVDAERYRAGWERTFGGQRLTAGPFTRLDLGEAFGGAFARNDPVAVFRDGVPMSPVGVVTRVRRGGGGSIDVTFGDAQPARLPGDRHA